MTTQTSEPAWETCRDQWLALIQHVLDEISQWALGNGWSIDRRQKEIREEKLGVYTAPSLRIRTPNGQLHVDPIARRVIGADGGRIDLEAWPSLNRVKLVRDQDQWRIITDSGVPIRQPWNQQTFVQLANDLVS